MKKVIIITIENQNVGDETQTGVDEALFDFGIGDMKPGHDGAEWPHLGGMCYEVLSVEVKDVEETP